MATGGHILISVTNDISFDQRMIKTANSLVSFGYQVTILGRRKKPIYNDMGHPFEVKRFSNLFSKGFLFYAEHNLRLFLHLLYHNYDIVCSVDLDTVFPAAILRKWKGYKLVYDAHEYFTEVPELVHRPYVKAVWKSIERYAMSRIDTLYTVSIGISDMFKSEYARPCSIIYNFPRKRDQEEDPRRSKDKIILYQGDLNEGRGLESMIQSMIDIPQCQLHIVGDGYSRKKLEDLVTQLGLEDSVIFLGYILPNELKEYTDRAWLGLNLLENKGLNHYYSLANKFFDTIQAGVPVLTMDFPEYRYFEEQYHCALLIPDLDPQTIRAAILHLLSNQNIYDDLVKNCHLAGRFLNWEAQEEKLSSIYQNV